MSIPTMRLSTATLSRLPDGVARPAYDRAAQAVGIVHIGIGAFHRAHQAAYTDDAMNAGDRNWAIMGVSLRSTDVRDQMAPQDGLYTLTQRSAAGDAARLIGAVQGALHAPSDPQAVIARIAAPQCAIVSLTVTEKGYCRAADGTLDFENPAVASDVLGQAAPASIYGYLARGMASRRAAGLPGITILCCDNLSHNGRVVAALLTQFLDRVDPSLSAWFRAECACPSTMVDRIVPATTADDRARTAAALGMVDDAAVVTEPFRQWVIEDSFAGPRPRWDVAGAQFVADVGPYETAKLRMLNGAHSAIAYIGLMRGHEYVHQAMGDGAIAPLVRQLMLNEAAATLAPADGQDLPAYAQSLIDRFANSALPHRLIQIAMDGTQKIPQRWLETAAWHQQHGGAPCPAILTAYAAWLAFVRADIFPVADPMADALAAMWHSADAGGAGDGAADDAAAAAVIARMTGPQSPFASHWQGTSADRASLVTMLAGFLAGAHIANQSRSG
ncbi:MAG: mannitol dehydrogenase family protein [Sphingopyxis sp.]